MNELVWWKRILVILVLGTLAVLLYFSAAGFFNIWVVPMMQQLSPETAQKNINFVLVGISFLAALISAFFSVFLYEMTGGGRPLLMGVVFALPVILIQLYVVFDHQLSSTMLAIYLVETLGALVAFVLVSFLGRKAFRRFFATGDQPA
ncbi:MAG TPA: hypothetical protein EYP90_05265 [Chromatiaceae bacterium]|nr:hypothetical protein [Chromatiaceae bacterium]